MVIEEWGNRVFKLQIVDAVASNSLCLGMLSPLTVYNYLAILPIHYDLVMQVEGFVV